MATILKFDLNAHDGQRERANEPLGSAPALAEVIVFPRMGLKYLCHIAEVMKGGREKQASGE